MKNATKYQKLYQDEQDLEIAQDLSDLSEKPRYRPGYKQYRKSAEYHLDQFLDQLDAERRGWR